MILLLLVYLETLKQQSHRQREPETTRWLQQMHKIRQKALQTEGESRELRWGGVHSLHRLRSLRKVQTVEPNWVLSGGIWSFGTEKKSTREKKESQNFTKPRVSFYHAGDEPLRRCGTGAEAEEDCTQLRLSPVATTSNWGRIFLSWQSVGFKGRRNSELF